MQLAHHDNDSNDDVNPEILEASRKVQPALYEIKAPVQASEVEWGSHYIADRLCAAEQIEEKCADFLGALKIYAEHHYRNPAALPGDENQAQRMALEEKYDAIVQQMQKAGMEPVGKQDAPNPLLLRFQQKGKTFAGMIEDELVRDYRNESLSDNHPLQYFIGEKLGVKTLVKSPMEDKTLRDEILTSALGHLGTDEIWQTLVAAGGPAASMQPVAVSHAAGNGKRVS